MVLCYKKDIAMRQLLPCIFLTLSMGVLPIHADNWMKRLPDKTFVSTLSIPGSHDAATGSGWASLEDMGDRYAKTQELTIAEQWTLGVRAFDLRPCAYEGYLNVNHGIMPTKLHFDEVLMQLRDSLVANPSEFVILHVLHAKDGDMVENYEQQLMQLMVSDELKDYLVDFKKNLRVQDLRGKMLLLSRDQYADQPVTGGIFMDWSGEVNWEVQSQGRIVGRQSEATCYVQDYSDTHQPGDVDKKVGAILTMLDYSSKHYGTMSSNKVWMFNLASAYSMIESFFGYELSLSDGYRDNATYTNAAIVDYLSTVTRPTPTGVILMDFAGVDESNGYKVRGKELVHALIENNFTYIEDVLAGVSATTASDNQKPACYSLKGECLSAPRRGEVNVLRLPDGTVRKVKY